MDRLIDMPRSDQICLTIRGSCDPSQTIAFVSGNFNVVHPGHLRLLKFAAEQADILVVGVNPDTTPGVTLPQDMRLDNVRSISMVDHAVAPGRCRRVLHRRVAAERRGQGQGVRGSRAIPNRRRSTPMAAGWSSAPANCASHRCRCWSATAEYRHFHGPQAARISQAPRLRYFAASRQLLGKMAGMRVAGDRRPDHR